MQRIHYEFVLEAKQPICHSQENLGNESVFMRRKVRQKDGTWAMVPYITADTMRHGLRKAGAYAFLDAAGLLDEQGDAKNGIGEAALRLLFSGGMVTGRGDASRISMDAFREMSELCPHLALLGGCTDNRVVPGRVECDEGTLICHEQARYLPDWVLEWDGLGAVDTCRAHIEAATRVRMDPTLDPGNRKLLSSSEQVEVTKRLENAERAHHADDAIARDDAKSSMMPRTHERLAQGSLFWWGVTAYTYSDLDVDTFRVMVAAFLSNARIGGKKGTGHGWIYPVIAKDISVSRPSENVSALQIEGQTFGSLFRAHVADRKERIKSWLEHVNS